MCFFVDNHDLTTVSSHCLIWRDVVACTYESPNETDTHISFDASWCLLTDLEVLSVLLPDKKSDEPDKKIPHPEILSYCWNVLVQPIWQINLEPDTFRDLFRVTKSFQDFFFLYLSFISLLSFHFSSSFSFFFQAPAMNLHRSGFLPQKQMVLWVASAPEHQQAIANRYEYTSDCPTLVIWWSQYC